MEDGLPVIRRFSYWCYPAASVDEERRGDDILICAAFALGRLAQDYVSDFNLCWLLLVRWCLLAMLVPAGELKGEGEGVVLAGQTGEGEKCSTTHLSLGFSCFVSFLPLRPSKSVKLYL